MSEAESDGRANGVTIRSVTTLHGPTFEHTITNTDIINIHQVTFETNSQSLTFRHLASSRLALSEHLGGVGGNEQERLPNDEQFDFGIFVLDHKKCHCQGSWNSLCEDLIPNKISLEVLLLLHSLAWLGPK